MIINPIHAQDSSATIWKRTTAARGDYMHTEGTFCNFTSAIASETIPNFSKQYGDYDWSYYTAHPEEDPNGKKDTEKFSLNVGDDVVEPLTDPFSTVAVTKGGYYGHFINAAKYGQTPDEEWKDYWVKLKISYNIPQSELPENFDPDKLPQNAQLTLYFHDPDFSNMYESCTDPPSNPNAYNLDKTGRNKGLDNEIDPIKNKFYSGFWWESGNPHRNDLIDKNYKDLKPDPILKIPVRDLPSNPGYINVFFRTERYGGNNYVPKAILGIPSCYMWDKLDKEIVVWKKYPIFVTYLQTDLESKNGSVRQSITSLEIPDKPIAEYIKRSFDDGFIFTFVQHEEMLKFGSYHTETDYYTWLYTYIGGKFMKYWGKPDTFSLSWMHDLSNIDSSFHDWSFNRDIVNNIHLIISSEGFEEDNIGGYSTMFSWLIGESDNENPVCIVHSSLGSEKLTFNTIHELGHTIGHLDHFPIYLSDLKNLSVMNYLWEESDGYPFTEQIVPLKNGRSTTYNWPVLTFNTDHAMMLREGSILQHISPKWAGFYFRRSQP